MKGLCLSMCPLQEKEIRIRSNDISLFECFDLDSTNNDSLSKISLSENSRRKNDKIVNDKIMVKRFHRVGSAMSFYDPFCPQNIRTIETLSITLNHLVVCCLPSISSPSSNHEISLYQLRIFCVLKEV
jgi:hypothetical protein